MFGKIYLSVLKEIIFGNIKSGLKEDWPKNGYWIHYLKSLKIFFKINLAKNKPKLLK